MDYNWVSLLIFAMLMLCCVGMMGGMRHRRSSSGAAARGGDDHISEGDEKYVCPMDGYTSDKPGRCARCGMELQKKSLVRPK